MDANVTTRLTLYQRRLFWVLSVASFFQGYNNIALASLLPNLTDELGLTPTLAGILILVRDCGGVLSYLLIRKADRWGRRSLLVLTIGGYTVTTLLTGLSWGFWSFATFQFLTQVFLMSELAVSTVYAAEEFPAARRGTLIGIISGAASLGALVCAGAVPFLLMLPFGWRSVFFFGAIPLIVMARWRRGLRETNRFVQQVGTGVDARSITYMFRTGYRGRLLIMAAVTAFANIAVMNSINFWKQFAFTERGLDDESVAAAIAVASLSAMPLVFLIGKLVDIIGRRAGAVVVFSLTAAGVYGAYSLHAWWSLTLMLWLAIVGIGGITMLINALAAELFPTEIRSEAFGWSVNFIGIAAYLPSPGLIGHAAESIGWGAAVRITVIFPILAFILILATVRETKGRDIDDTARLD